MDQDLDSSAAVRPRPLSPAQLPILRAEVLRRDTPRWTQVTIIRLNGLIDPETLERAIEIVVARHPALRTQLQRRAGKVLQTFPAAVSFHLARHEWPVGDQNEDEDAAIQDFLLTIRHDGFKLYGGALFRADLLVLAPQRSALVLRMHHIAADGVALGLIVLRIAAAYRGDMCDREPDLSYERWLDRQEVTAPSDLRAAASHYRHTLAGASPHSDALYDQLDKADRREPPELAEATSTLDAASCDRLRALARAQGATLFIVLFAAFANTLRSFTQQDDLVIATFASGRIGEPAPVIGSCINTLLVRVRLGVQHTAVASIEAVKEAWRPVRRHQTVPMALLSGIDGAALPLAQYAINFLDMNETSFDAPGLSSSVTHAQQGFPLNDVLLYALREQDGRLRLRLIAGSGTPRLSQSRLYDILEALMHRIHDWTLMPGDTEPLLPA